MTIDDLMTQLKTMPPFAQFVELAATLEGATLQRDGANVFVAFADEDEARAFVKAYEQLMAFKASR